MIRVTIHRIDAATVVWGTRPNGPKHRASNDIRRKTKIFMNDLIKSYNTYPLKFWNLIVILCNIDSVKFVINIL